MAETDGAPDAASLDARLRDIEDRLEIYNLIASHPLDGSPPARDILARPLERHRPAE